MKIWTHPRADLQVEETLTLEIVIVQDLPAAVETVVTAADPGTAVETVVTGNCPVIANKKSAYRLSTFFMPRTIYTDVQAS